MTEMPAAILLTAALFAGIGHAYVLTTALNVAYGCPLPKWFLRSYRLLTAVAILAFPSLVALTESTVVVAYLAVCLALGALVYPGVTLYRLLRSPPSALLEERTETVDYGKELGATAFGNGKNRFAVRLPFTCALKVDFTEWTLAVPRLPTGWDGLTVLLLSDIHFHGTPSREFFERVFDRLAATSPPDLVVLAGDYVDTNTHSAWIVPLLGRLTAVQGKYAVLGNHDQHHDPDRVRSELTAAGYRVLGNGWQEATIRGERCVVVGHEGPWFRPAPDLSAAPPDLFRLCVSHTPDNFAWGQRQGTSLMLCGHVHGGQIRLPVIGSIFVPSMYGRRFDMGVFESGGTLMVVGRGLSGKEPLRIRCHPQVIRITLRCRPSAA